MSNITPVSIPLPGSRGCYLDDPIYLFFANQIESSYINTDFIKLYRTNEACTEFYDMVGATIEYVSAVPGIEGDVHAIKIKPMANLQPEQFYMALVTGGEYGIYLISGETISDNLICTFMTGTIIRPTAAEDQSVINPGEQYLPGDTVDISGSKPSTDLFSQVGENTPITLMSIVPENLSVGVHDLNKIVLIYDDIVNDSIPSNMISGKYSEVPFDRDPFGDHDISISGVTAENNTISFNIGTIIADHPSNTEFTFRIPKYVVRGMDKKGLDDEKHTIKFMSRLTPVYATPDQIKSRISAWSDTIDIQTSDYGIWKLILEKSLIVDDVLARLVASGTEVIPIANRMIQVNQAVICMVLRDMIGYDTLFNGNIKSRTLLATIVVYDNSSAKDIIDALDNCIRENLPEIPVHDGYYAMGGIKSGVSMPRNKNYGVYR